MRDSTKKTLHYCNGCRKTTWHEKRICLVCGKEKPIQQIKNELVLDVLPAYS
jgi:rRNA maturation endonuclease Nob1